MSLNGQIRLKDREDEDDKEAAKKIEEEEKKAEEAAKKFLENKGVGRRANFVLPLNSAIIRHIYSLNLYRHYEIRNMRSKFFLGLVEYVKKNKLEKEARDYNSLKFLEILAEYPGIKGKIQFNDRVRMEFLRRALTQYYNEKKSYPRKLSKLKVRKEGQTDQNKAPWQYIFNPANDQSVYILQKPGSKARYSMMLYMNNGTGGVSSLSRQNHKELMDQISFYKNSFPERGKVKIIKAFESSETDLLKFDEKKGWLSGKEEKKLESFLRLNFGNEFNVPEKGFQVQLKNGDAFQCTNPEIANGNLKCQSLVSKGMLVPLKNIISITEINEAVVSPPIGATFISRYGMKKDLGSINNDKELRFHSFWKNKLSLSISISTTLRNNYYISIRETRGKLYVYIRNARSIQKSLDLKKAREIDLKIKFSHKDNKIYFTLNGSSVGSYTFAKQDGEKFHFNAYSSSNLFLNSFQIKDLVAREGNASDSVLLTNGDKMKGSIKGLTKNIIALKTEIMDFKLPLDKVKKLNFKTDIIKPENSPYQVFLKDGSSLTGKIISMDKTQVTIENSCLGKVSLSESVLYTIRPLN